MHIADDVKNRIKISGSVIAFNEEDKIARCIESLWQVCDEIVVVDSHSTDRTAEIAVSLGATVCTQEFLGHIEQKNFALSKTKNDLILSLDADEALSDELISSIHQLDEINLYDAYRCNRLNNYCGQWIRHGTWYPDRKVRLWDKSKGSWGGQNPHDKVILQKDARVQFIAGDILHYTATTKEEWAEQIEKFSSIAAQQIAEELPRSSLYHRTAKPFFRFLQSYILRFGFLDGRAGYEIALGQAKMVRLRYVKADALR